MTKKSGVTRRSFGRLTGGLFVGGVVGAGVGCEEPTAPVVDGGGIICEVLRQEPFWEPQVEVPNGREPLRDIPVEGKGSSLDASVGDQAPDERQMLEPSIPEEPVVEQGPEWEPVDVAGRTFFAVDLNKEPDMKTVGWYINVHLPSGDIVFLFRRSKTTLVTISGVCTHKGCFVGWRSDQNRFLCPCHAATFSADGKVTGGPAPQDLKTYPTAWDARSNTAYIFLDR